MQQLQTLIYYYKQEKMNCEKTILFQTEQLKKCIPLQEMERWSQFMLQKGTHNKAHMHIAGEYFLRKFNLSKLQISNILRAFDPATLKLLEGVTGWVVLPAYFDQKKINDSEIQIFMKDFQLGVTGKCKVNESYIDAIIRETKEELYLDINRHYIKSLGKAISGAKGSCKNVLPSIINITNQEKSENVILSDDVKDDRQRHIQSWVFVDTPDHDLILNRKSQETSSTTENVVVMIPAETLKELLNIFIDSKQKPYPSDPIFSDGYALEGYCCKSFQGSMDVQEKLVQMSEEAISRFLQVLKYGISVIHKNKYGKYVVKLLLQLCNEDQREKLMRYIRTDIVKGNKNGQELITIFNNSKQKPYPSDPKFFNRHALESYCCRNFQGSMDVQEKLSQMSAEAISQFIQVMKQGISNLHKHKFGKFVVKKLLYHCSEDQRDKVMGYLETNFVKGSTNGRTNETKSYPDYKPKSQITFGKNLSKNT